jgi:hypothetical protein
VLQSAEDPQRRNTSEAAAQWRPGGATTDGGQERPGQRQLGQRDASSYLVGGQYSDRCLSANSRTQGSTNGDATLLQQSPG